MEDKKLIEIFRDRLKDLMADNNIFKINDLAKKIDIPRTTISNWLNLCRTPQIDSLVIIAKFFDVTSDYLLGLKDYP